MEEVTGQKKKGFASLSKERRAEIARMGGKAAHACGNAHQFTSAEAAAAGRKGGRGKRRKAVAVVETQDIAGK